jgi:hypothetical protein
MTRLVIVTVLARLVIAGAYVWVSYHVINLVVARSHSPLPVATQALKAGHKIVAGDLQTAETAAFVDQFLRKDVAKGSPVTPDMVSPRQLPPELAPTIAAIVMIPVRLLKQRNIADGSAVEIQLANSPLKLPGKVVKLYCDEQTCAVIVSLAKIPPSTIGPADFSSADILPEPPPLPPPNGP